VALGQPWGDPVAGLAVTGFICHVGYEITRDVLHRLAGGIDPGVITAAEAAAGSVPGVVHAHARARWTGRTLRVEIEGWVDPDLPAREADAVGRQVAEALTRQLPEAGSFALGQPRRAGLTPWPDPGAPLTGAAPAARGDRRRPGSGDRGARGPR